MVHILGWEWNHPFLVKINTQKSSYKIDDKKHMHLQDCLSAWQNSLEYHNNC